MVGSEDASCPPSEVIVTFVDRTLPQSQRAIVEQHLDVCADCRVLIAQLCRGAAPAAVGTQPGTLSRGAQIGRYVIVESLASGGMGAVYIAYDPELDRKIALKLLRPDRQTDPEAKTRLQREAQAMARLQDPNVVTVYDVGSAGELVYIAMELVDGGTLRSWLRARRRSRAEIMTIFRFAGKGLAAAHRAGLVHRDFKPDNVLVAADGRVRVTDFGLASPLGFARALASDDELPDEALTQTGALIGTPAYMAPEQLRGEGATVRSDQFSFSVTLCEALWGTRPFSGQTPGEMYTRMSDGIRDEPTAMRRAPVWLRRALVRGLSMRPEDRWPSVDALVDALHAGMQRVRRRWITAAAVLVVLVTGIVVVAGTADPTAGRVAMCGPAMGRLAGVWDSARKAEIAAAFTATNRSYASGAWQGTERLLDAYTASWLDARVDACAATRVRHEQSEPVMDLRIGCLDRRLEQVRALSETFAHADAEIVTHAVEATSALPPINECADTRSLAEILPVPDDPAAAADIAWVQTQLDNALALEETGRYAPAEHAVEALVPAARLLAYAPLLAEVLLQVANLRRVSGQLIGIEDALTKALAVSDEARDDGMRSQVLEALLRLAIEQGHFGQAHLYADQAEGVSRRRGAVGSLDALLDESITVLLDSEGKFTEAYGRGRRAIARAESAFGVDSLNVARASSELGLIAYHVGNLDDAERAFQRALAISTKLGGPSNPELVNALQGLAEVEAARDDFSGALAFYDRELHLASEALGPGNVFVAPAIQGMGFCQLQLGRGDEAVRTLRRAVDILRANHAEDNVYVANALDELANALLETDQPDEAAADDEAALATFERVGPTTPEASQIRADLARIRVRQGRGTEAIALIDTSVANARAGGDDQRQLLTDLLGVRGGILRDVRRYREAASTYQEAITKLEPAGDNLDLGGDLVGLGQALLDSGDRDGGVRALSRGVDMMARRNAVPVDLAAARFELARGLWTDPAERPHALALAREARVTIAAAAHSDLKLTEIDAWLTTHAR